MKRFLHAALLAIVVALAPIGAVDAQQHGWQLPAARTYAGFERLTLNDASVRSLAGIPAKDGATPVRYMVVFVEGGDIRFRLDAGVTPPTAAIGVPIRADGWMPFMIDSDTMANLRFIRQTAVTVELWVLYFW